MPVCMSLILVTTKGVSRLRVLYSQSELVAFIVPETFPLSFTGCDRQGGTCNGLGILLLRLLLLRFLRIYHIQIAVIEITGTSTPGRIFRKRSSKVEDSDFA